jgi:hypothetical protein
MQRPPFTIPKRLKTGSQITIGRVCLASSSSSRDPREAAGTFFGVDGFRSRVGEVGPRIRLLTLQSCLIRRLLKSVHRLSSGSRLKSVQPLSQSRSPPQPLRLRHCPRRNLLRRGLLLPLLHLPRSAPAIHSPFPSQELAHLPHRRTLIRVSPIVGQLRNQILRLFHREPLPPLPHIPRSAPAFPSPSEELPHPRMLIRESQRGVSVELDGRLV